MFILYNDVSGFTLQIWCQQTKKKKKKMLIGTSQKLRCADKTCMSLFLNDVKLEEAIAEKLLGIWIDKYLTWNLHIDYLISKLNCRINLLKRFRKLLYNSLIKPIL